MNKHALISPSKASRWIDCVGSASLEYYHGINIPNKYSNYGTLCHRYFSMYLIKKSKEKKYLVKTDVPERGSYELKKDLSVKEIEELERAAENLILDIENFCLGERIKSNRVILYIEKKLNFNSLNFRKLFFGTPDVVIVILASSNRMFIFIYDLKTGRIKIKPGDQNKAYLKLILSNIDKINGFLTGSYANFYLYSGIIQKNYKTGKYEKETEALDKGIYINKEPIKLESMKKIDMALSKILYGKNPLFLDNIIDLYVTDSSVLLPDSKICRYCTASYMCPAIKNLEKELK